MKKFRSLIILLIASLTLAGTSCNVFAEKSLQLPLNQTLVMAAEESSNPHDYDPATTHGSGDRLAFSGLVAFNPHINLIPDLAASWDVNSAGTVYTFHLQPNARFQDGRSVTAQDVIYSWERAANPQTKSDTVLTYLGDIVGVNEMHAGKASSISGLKAIDDHTLQVTIDAPKPYFLLKLTYATGLVVDKANIESGSDWVYHPNGTGPYKLVEWDHGQQIIYQSNANFYLGEPRIPFVVYEINQGNSQNLYEDGRVDISYVNSIDRFLDPTEPLHQELYAGVSLCTDYVVFDVTKPPFDDVKVRQAFSMAFDRQKYVDIVMGGHALPAIGLYPPALPGFNSALTGLPFDSQRARQLLAESKYGSASALPPIVYSEGGIGSYIDSRTAALAQMWKQYLGVTITVENIEPNFYYDQLYSGHHGQLFSGGWCADYPDPENFADALFHTGAEQNTGGYSNPKLDTLLEAARIERDVNKRIQMYQQAEQMIVNDAPVLFTVHSLMYMLVKPYVKGYVLTSIDKVSIERYMSLDGK